MGDVDLQEDSLAQILTLSFTRCWTMTKSLYLPGPQVPDLQNGN